MTPILVLFSCVLTFCFTRVFHVNPVTGSIDGDGSESQPFSTFYDLIENGKIKSRKGISRPFVYWGDVELEIKNPDGEIQANDTILLYSGYHGGPNNYISFREYLNEDFIIVKAAENHKPYFGRTFVTACSKWVFEGISFNMEEAIRPFDKTQVLLYVTSDPDLGPLFDFIVRKCSFYTLLDMSSWTKTEWSTEAIKALGLGSWGSSGENGKSGFNIVVENSHLFNIGNGGHIMSPHTTFRRNLVEYFSGDGMWLGGWAHNALITENVFRNCLKVDGNHDDGIQGSATIDSVDWLIPLENVTLSKNVIIQYDDRNQIYRKSTHPEYLNHGIQGIGFFDGPYFNFTVEGNFIQCRDPIGISFRQPLNSTFRYNTIVDQEEPVDYHSPNILLYNHKNEKLAKNNEITRNVVNRVYVHEAVCLDEECGNEIHKNLEIGYYEYNESFVRPMDYSVRDVRWRILGWRLKYLPVEHILLY